VGPRAGLDILEKKNIFPPTGIQATDHLACSGHYTDYITLASSLGS